jgi:hypothetical protein
MALRSTLGGALLGLSISRLSSWPNPRMCLVNAIEVRGGWKRVTRTS